MTQNAAPAEKTVAPVPPVKEPKIKDEKNGVTRPSDFTKRVGRVWAISDEISAKLGSPAPRADVLAQAKSEGLNESTITTQYGRWRTYNGLKGIPQVRAPKAEKVKKPKKVKAVATEAAETATVE